MKRLLLCHEWMSDRSVYPIPVWRRWDLDIDEDLEEVETLPEKQFFELCPLPFLPGDSLLEDDAEEIDIRFAPFPVRMVLRHIPTIVLIATIAVIVEAELRSDVVGVSTVLQGMQVAPLLFFLFVWGGIITVFIKSGIVPRDTFLKSIIIASLVGTLTVGTLYEAYYTFSTSVPDGGAPHVSYMASTLLVSLIAGMFAYDLLLKGENMFSKLGRTNIFDEELYEAFKQDLSKELKDGIFGIRYGYVFATLFLLNFVVIWSVNGPVGLGLVSGWLFTLILDFVLLVGVFQFLIGITGLRKIMRGRFTVNGETLEPTYLPYHPDGHAGFGDIGRCAMQINVIMIIVGLFYVWRGYFAGLRNFPTISKPSIAPFYADHLGIMNIVGTPGYEWIIWSANYLLPIVAYLLIVSFWFYYTFWEIHKRMVKGKKDTILAIQSDKREAFDVTNVNMEGDSTDRPNHRSLPVGEYDDRGPWQSLYDAPEWPINTRKLAWIVSGNAVPVLFSIPTLIPELIVL